MCYPCFHPAEIGLHARLTEHRTQLRGCKTLASIVYNITAGVHQKSADVFNMKHNPSRTQFLPRSSSFFDGLSRSFSVFILLFLRWSVY